MVHARLTKVRTSVVLACLPVLLQLFARVSHAETVAVVDLTASTSEHVKVASMRRKAVIAGHTVVADREIRASLVDGVHQLETENGKATARKDILEAERLFGRLALEEAQAHLTTAEKKTLEQSLSEATIAVLADTEFLRGQISMAAGDEKGGRAAFTLVRLLAPARTALDPAEFPPAIRESYSAAVATLSHQVRIESSPAGARVVLDGIDVGVTPVETIASEGVLTTCGSSIATTNRASSGFDSMVRQTRSQQRLSASLENSAFASVGAC